MASSPKATPRNIGTYIAERIAQLGVKDYFAVPGDYNLLLLDQLLLDERLRMVNCCNELNAAYAADGYARANALGVLIVTFTVGGLSAINAVAGAASDNLPILVLSGGPNSNDFGSERILHHTIGDTNFNQQLECFKQFCCHCDVIKSAESGTWKIDEALTKCISQRKPVYLEICCNVAAIDHFSCASPQSELSLVQRQSNPNNLKLIVDKAIAVLDKAVKPVLVAGCGVKCGNAAKAFMAFAEASGYAWATMPDVKGKLPETHPNYIGTYWGAVSSPYCCETVESADFYVIVGPRFNDYTTVGYSLLISTQKSITLGASQSIVCGHDAHTCVEMADVLEEMAKRVKKNTASMENYKRMFVPTGLPPSLGQLESKVTTNVLFHHIQSMLTGDMAVVAETGDSWFNGQKLKLPEGCLYEFQMQFGSIGWSVGATLGMACALAGKKRVVQLVGDGSFQMTAQEVSTMIRFGANPIIFLINNDGYTIEVEIHDGPYNNIQMWDYCGLIRAFSKTGESSGRMFVTRVETEGELVEAIKTAESKPDALCFIEVITLRDDCSKELLEWGARVASANGRPPVSDRTFREKS